MLVSIDGAVSPLPVTDQPVLTFGRDASLCSFPLHQLVATLTATINDTNVTVNVDSVLRELLRLTDYKKNRLVRTCPTMLDKYADYNDAYLAVNNPLASYLDATESAEVPNGAWYNIRFTDATGAVLIAQNVVGDYGYYSANGVSVAFLIGSGANRLSSGIPIRTRAGLPPAVPAYVADNAPYPIFIRFGSTEKLLLSPFIFADSAEWETGLFGINNIQIVCNMKGTADRVIRHSTAGGRSISNVAYNTAQPFPVARVLVQYLTPSLDLPLPPKSIIPFMEYPRYLTTYSSQSVSPFADFTIQSQTIVLPQIPDLLVIYVKPQSYGATDADWYYPIRNISVNWDNFAGLLSSHTTQQLYQMSVHNGMDMDFNEWFGQARSGRSGNLVQTVGGMLVLKPSQDLTLQSGQAPGLIGNYTLQFNLTCNNPTADTTISPQLYVITINSGFFETLAGSSRIVKGVLSEADIISAEIAPESSNMARLVGTGIFDRLGSFVTKAKDIYTATKPVVSGIKNMLPDEGVAGKLKKGLTMAGYGQAGAGRAGGGMAGGGMAGGRKSLSERLM